MAKQVWIAEVAQSTPQTLAFVQSLGSLID
jgi:hypothetical protein